MWNGSPYRVGFLDTVGDTILWMISCGYGLLFFQRSPSEFSNRFETAQERIKSAQDDKENIHKSQEFDYQKSLKRPRQKEVQTNPIARRLTERREYILEACKNLSLDCNLPNVLKRSMFFFHKHNTSVCTIAKSASSTWRAHLQRVNSRPHSKKSVYQDYIRMVFLKRSLKDVETDINSFSRIITVRHPLTRLVSAFRNKFNGGKPIRKHKRSRKGTPGSDWRKKFHLFWLPALFANNMVPPNTHLKVGVKEPINPRVLYSVGVYKRLRKVLRPKISFVKFLNLVLKTYKEGYADAHWRSYHDQCCPCYFDYHYITKVETLSEELKYVFKKLGIPANPNTIKNQKRESVKYLDAYFEYYRKVPIKIRRELYEYLKTDMDLFGYSLPENFLS